MYVANYILWNLIYVWTVPHFYIKIMALPMYSVSEDTAANVSSIYRWFGRQSMALIYLIISVIKLRFYTKVFTQRFACVWTHKRRKKALELEKYHSVHSQSFYIDQKYFINENNEYLIRNYNRKCSNCTWKT